MHNLLHTFTHTFTHAHKKHAHCTFRTYKNPAWQALDPLAGSLEEYVLTAGDDGRIRIFNYPCVVENAPNRCQLQGHRAHS